ncbi:SDR family oxidoreductase [Sinorhizobium medicae]
MPDKPLIAITGASSGIGEAVARAFSRAGHPLLLIARRLDRLEALGLPNALLKKADVRDRAALAAAVGEAEARFGPVDMMFANAGIARLGDIARQAPEEWDEMIDINTKGAMNSVHAVLSGMIGRKHGTLVMMSSIAGRKVYPDHTVYCGTKFFVHAVSESLREYLAPHDVRVIVVSPRHYRYGSAGSCEGRDDARQLQGEQSGDRRRHFRRRRRRSHPRRLSAAAASDRPGNRHHADPTEILTQRSRRRRDGRPERRME